MKDHLRHRFHRDKISGEIDLNLSRFKTTDTPLFPRLGDSNSSFFHAAERTKQAINSIRSIVGKSGIRGLAARFYVKVTSLTCDNSHSIQVIKICHPRPMF